MNQYGLILKEGRPELLLQGTPLAGKRQNRKKIQGAINSTC